MQRAFFITAAAIAVTTEATKFEYTPENQILAELDSQVGAFPEPKPDLYYGIPSVLDFWTGGKTAFKPKLTDIIENKPDGYEKLKWGQKYRLIEQSTKDAYADTDDETRAEERITDWPHHTLQFLSIRLLCCTYLSISTFFPYNFDFAPARYANFNFSNFRGFKFDLAPKV